MRNVLKDSILLYISVSNDPL